MNLPTCAARTIRHSRLHPIAALLAGLVLVAPAAAVNIVINIDNGTLNGIASGGSFNGTTFISGTNNQINTF